MYVSLSRPPSGLLAGASTFVAVAPPCRASPPPVTRIQAVVQRYAMGAVGQGRAQVECVLLAEGRCRFPWRLSAVGTREASGAVTPGIYGQSGPED